MYTIYNVEGEKNECAVVFRSDGKRMTVDNGIKEVEISREELEQLVEWLKVNLEKLNRDYWDAMHSKNMCCDPVHPA